MTTLIILACILLAGFGLLAYAKSRITKIRRKAFEEAVRAELLSAHRQVSRETDFSGMSAHRCKAIFDKRAEKVTKLFAEQYYGDAGKIPFEQLQTIRSFIRELRQQIGRQVHTM